MIKHLIFDFDGTISDSYPHFADFFRKFGKERKLPLPENDFDLLKLLLISIKDAFFMLGWDSYVPYSVFEQEYFATQREKFMEFRAFPEAVDLLKYATG